MLHELMFSIPGKFAAGLLDGSIVRYGTVLKDAGSGRILAHIQETGLAQQLLSNVGIHSFTPLGAILTGANIASSGYANVQLHQLKGMVEAMQVLQYANIGIAAAGLGVSAIGFAVINRRLKGIKNDIEKLSARVENQFQEIRSTHWREHFSRIQVYVDRAERAYQLSQPKTEWLMIEAKLNEESGYLSHTIQDQLDRPHFDVEWFQQISSSLLLCDSVRLKCLLKADELKLARSTASAVGKSYADLFDSISPTRLADKITRFSTDHGKNEQMLYREHKQQALLISNNLQEVTDAALSKPLLIEHLIDRDINGSQYLEDIAGHNQNPVILLTT